MQGTVDFRYKMSVGRDFGVNGVEAEKIHPSCPPPPLSTGILYSPQFRSHQETNEDGGPSNSTIDIK